MLDTLETAQPTNRTFNRLPVTDFSGGLCLYGENLGDNQSPDLLNVEIQPDGSVCSRRSRLEPAHQNVLPAAVCSATQMQFYGQRATILVSLENGEVWNVDCASGFASPTKVPTSSDPVNCKWRAVQATNVVYFYNGIDQPVALYPDGSCVTLNQTWNDEVEGSQPAVVGYEQPCCEAMPIAKKMAFFQGKLWAADITYPTGTQPLSDRSKGQEPDSEEGLPGVKNPEGLNAGVEERCNRIHFSFPIQGETGPEDWNSNDWFDLDEGQDGECITALVECGSVMYVFKEHSIYAVQLGLNGEPSIAKISSKSGVKDCDQVICCDGVLFFFDIRSGLRVIGADGLQPQAISQKIWRDLVCLTDAQLCEVKVGFCKGKIFLSVPALENTFVLDTNLPSAPWTRVCWNVDGFYLFCPSDAEGHCMAFSNCSNYLLKINDDLPLTTETLFDNYGGGKYIVPDSYYTTNWFGNSLSSVSNPLSVKEWCDIDLVGYGENMSVVFASDLDSRSLVGSSKIDFKDNETQEPIVLGQFCFPEVKLVDPGCGRPVIASCLELGGPCFSVERDVKNPFVKSKAVCPSLPNVSTCSLQLKISATGPWCICNLSLSFREYPNAKERNAEAVDG